MKKALLFIICGTLAIFAVSCDKSSVSGTKKCKCTIHEPGIERPAGEYEIPKNESCSQFNKEWWEDDISCWIKCREVK